jgi:hypothetical protein
MVLQVTTGTEAPDYSSLYSGAKLRPGFLLYATELRSDTLIDVQRCSQPDPGCF